MSNAIPDLTSPPQQIPYSVRAIDFTGDKASDNWTGLDTAKVAPATLQALNVALGGASEASYYEGVVKDAYVSIPDKNNATSTGGRAETSNVINLLAKHPDGRSESGVIRAPSPALFIANSDDIDPTSTELANVLTAWLAILPDNFEVVSVRYSGRKQYNQAVPI